MSIESNSMIQPEQGRACARFNSDGATITTGVMFFPGEFRPLECAAYLSILSDDRISIMADALDAGLPDPHHHGVPLGQLCTSPVWYRTTDPNACTIRFVDALPDQNGWSFVAVSTTRFVPALDQAGSNHIWYDIHAGRCSSILGVPARGEAVSSLLRSRAIWPDRMGCHWSLPAMPSQWRAPMHRYHQLLAAYGRGEITRDECTAALSSDPTLQTLASGRPDDDYCRYLAALEEEGGLRIEAPQSPAQLRLSERRASDIVRRLNA